MDALEHVRRSPIVDPGGVTFVYRGAADAVNLRLWIHGLPATQPFERVGEADLWVLRVELPENSRIEYKFAVTRDGREEWILDPLNPLRAAGSLRRQFGGAGPRLRASGMDRERRAGACGRDRGSHRAQRGARRRAARRRLRAGPLPSQPAVPAADRARRIRLPALCRPAGRARQPDPSTRDTAADRRVHAVAGPARGVRRARRSRAFRRASRYRSCCSIRSRCTRARPPGASSARASAPSPRCTPPGVTRASSAGSRCSPGRSRSPTSGITAGRPLSTRWRAS